MANAAANLKTILETYWDTSIIALALIRDNSKLPVRFINKGLCIMDETADWHPAGFTHQQTDAMGKDLLRIYIIDSSSENIRLRIKAIAKCADLFNVAGGDSNYDKLYPHLQEIVFLKQWNDDPIPDFWKVAEMPIDCVLNNKNLYT